jgi:hypothetical protein
MSSLCSYLMYEPTSLAFGTSGRRGEVRKLTQLGRTEAGNTAANRAIIVPPFQPVPAPFDPIFQEPAE